MKDAKFLFIGGLADGQQRDIPINDGGVPPTQWLVVKTAAPDLILNEVRSNALQERKQQLYCLEAFEDRNKVIHFIYVAEGVDSFQTLIAGYRQP